MLFQLLAPALLASATPARPARVVCLSSSGHRGGAIHFGDHDLRRAGYTPFAAYGQSKLANVHTACEIERRYGAAPRGGVRAWSVHPGGIATPLQKHVDRKLLDGYAADAAVRDAMKSTEQGAATSVWAALSDDVLAHGGRYLEDCSVAGPKAEGAGPIAPGYAPNAYDEATASRLWEDSLTMVGLERDT